MDIAGAVGAAIGMGLALLSRNYVDLGDLGGIAVVIAIVVGIVLGRLAGSLLFRPPPGSGPDG